MAVWAALIGGGATLAGTMLDWSYKERSADESRESRKDQKEIALKKLGLTEKEIKLREKQRGFERLMKMIGTGNTLTQNAAGANRLTALRNSGQGR